MDSRYIKMRDLEKKDSTAEQKLESELKRISDEITALSENEALDDDIYTNKLTALLNDRNRHINEYFISKKWTVKSQLLITRHPQSTHLDKMLGTSPDATPSMRGVASLEEKDKKHARNFMSLLLRDPKQPVSFARSNMIRAGMLCNMIMDSPDIKIKSCINSREFQETQGKIIKAASTTPIPEEQKDKAAWRIRSKELEREREALSTAINNESEAIVKHHLKATYDKTKAKGICEKNTDKSKAINGLLRLPESTSAWLVGHGKTSSNYFKKEFGISCKFGFSTTKSVYLLTDKEGNEFKFSPPGGIKIRKNGRLKGVMRKGEHILNSQYPYVPTLKDKAKKFLKCLKTIGKIAIGLPIGIAVGVILSPLLIREARDLVSNQIDETKQHTQRSKQRVIMWSFQEAEERSRSQKEKPEPSEDEVKKLKP